MAKYNITEEWSNPFQEFYYIVRQYDNQTGRWVIMFSEKSLAEAEKKLFDFKVNKEIKPEIVREYEF